MQHLKSKKALVIFLLGVFTLGIILLLTVSLPPSYEQLPTTETQRVEINIVEPTVMFGMVVDSLHITEDVVKRNQRFTDLLEGYSVSPAVYQQLHFVPRNVFDFRKIAMNKKYTILSHRDSMKTVKALVYEANPIDYVIFHLEDTLWVEPCQREVVTEERAITGVVQSSLAETIGSMGITHELTNRFVDIFAWQIDFQRLQKGDQFKLIYEENMVEGQPIGIGKIIGVYFEHFGNPYYAFPFDQGDGLDYFNEDGQSLRKALLKYPIEFTRISSRYSRNRFHPVAKVFRPHLGTDFAADTGTPIRTVGDGIVLEARYNGNNGNYVKIRHNATYTTQYLHMSKIATGIKPGMKVRQGQVIGFVGSTGLAKGSHLCYRFWKNGVQVDALKVELPPSAPIKDESISSFQQVVIETTSRLDAIAFPLLEEQETLASGK
ncbi:MAG: peptidoglycan DD-metalloendopeptidase family protein [Cyclobacteriaceae bacterium]|nr:peptidoglycan DD-metalloendopeptidase family protein [Cyclobacteriaceae bacterium]